MIYWKPTQGVILGLVEMTFCSRIDARDAHMPSFFFLIAWPCKHYFSFFFFLAIKVIFINLNNKKANKKNSFTQILKCCLSIYQYHILNYRNSVMVCFNIYKGYSPHKFSSAIFSVLFCMFFFHMNFNGKLSNCKNSLFAFLLRLR